MGAVELHPLLGRAEDVDEPAVVVFDLDPGRPVSIIDCCRVALLVREWLSDAGLESFAKTSGSLGVHGQFVWYQPYRSTPSGKRPRVTGRPKT
jgi:bifunctional non-homologous end joining protein LigD